MKKLCFSEKQRISSHQRKLDYTAQDDCFGDSSARLVRRESPPGRHAVSGIATGAGLAVRSRPLGGCLLLRDQSLPGFLQRHQTVALFLVHQESVHFQLPACPGERDISTRHE